MPGGTMTVQVKHIGIKASDINVCPTSTVGEILDNLMDSGNLQYLGDYLSISEFGEFTVTVFTLKTNYVISW